MGSSPLKKVPVAFAPSTDSSNRNGITTPLTFTVASQRLARDSAAAADTMPRNAATKSLALMLARITCRCRSSCWEFPLWLQAQDFSQADRLAARHLDRSASTESDQKATSDGNVYFVNPFEIDDFFPPSPKKHRWIELLLQGVKRPADERTLGSEIDARIVAFGFQQENVGNPNDTGSLPLRDEHFLQSPSIR